MDGSTDRLPALAERLGALVGERPLGPQAGADAARRTWQLRDHLAAHVLPRARSLDAPLLVLLIGPTGAGSRACSTPWRACGEARPA